MKIDGALRVALAAGALVLTGCVAEPAADCAELIFGPGLQ